MKRIFCLITSISVSLVAFSQSPTVVAFYNLENLYDTINDPLINDEDFLPNGAYAYTTRIYQEKLDNLAFVLEKLGKDHNSDGFAVCGVAEIENEGVLNDLVHQKALKDRNLRIVQFNSPDARGIDVALLYNPKYFKVLGAKAVGLDLPLDASGEGKEKTRDILWVTGKLNGQLVHLFVNHWPSRRGGEAATAPKRNLAAKTGKRIMDSLIAADPGAKCITMGDLNDDPNNESITKFYNAKGKIKDVRKGAMFNPFLKFYNDGIGTMAYQDAWGLFDQIIISEALINKKTTGLHFEKAEVYNRSFLIEKFGQYKGYPKRAFVGALWNQGYSDHFPTLILLK
jgi:Endonuclease/Exonuclease/phosphatase family